MAHAEERVAVRDDSQQHLRRQRQQRDHGDDADGPLPEVVLLAQENPHEGHDTGEGDPLHEVNRAEEKGATATGIVHARGPVPA